MTIGILENGKNFRRFTGRFVVVSFLILHFGALSLRNCYRLASINVQQSVLLEKLRDIAEEIKSFAAAIGLNSYVNRYVTAISFTGAVPDGRMFAPDPPSNFRYLEVRVVTGWQKSQVTPATNTQRHPWNSDLDPIYDPTPLYRSYWGSFDQRMNTGAGPYTRQTKLAEFLLTKDTGKYLAQFAQFWEKNYESRYKKKPLGIHLVAHQVHINPPPDGAQAAPLETVTTKVVYGLDPNPNKNEQSGAGDVQDH